MTLLLIRCAAVSLAACVLLAAPAHAQTVEKSAKAVQYSKKGADTCLACHTEEVVLAVFRTRHAAATDPRSPFGSGQLQCEACHGPGGAHTGRVRRGRERPSVVLFGADAKTAISEQNGMCLNCHESNAAFAWHSGPHGNDEVACADCHVLHAPGDPVLQTSTQPEVCFDCHQVQRTQTLKAFAHPLFEAKMACSACHKPHGDTIGSSLARQTINDTCFQCHAEKRGPFLWEHAPVAEDCTTCHNPHGSNHPGMLARRAPLLCQSCHSQSGHPSLAYTPDGLPTGAPSQFLLGQSCTNCHAQVHGSNHPSGSKLMR